jgi:hypothetical protein
MAYLLICTPKHARLFRLEAVEIWAHGVATVPNLSRITPALLPQLARRMGHLPVQECAEVGSA